ncbi:MAG: cation:proton antiporter [Actinobacteria bacterium]|nr:cation:proton antiporter [Actinomycetota bacterium]
MANPQQFALLMLVIAGAGLLAVVSNRLTEWLKIPAPALFLAGAAVAAKFIPALSLPSEQTVKEVVTVALALILFEGGTRIGWPRFRSAIAPISVLGVIGTFLTVTAGTLFIHFAFELAWYDSLLLATAIAPTDPAVVFSVLGRRELSGASGTILEGESGTNDPVGIALMTGLVAAGGISAAAFVRVGITFVSEMAVGAGVGLVGGFALLWFARRVALPNEALYPLGSLAGVLVIFALATLAGGSGFLAVFVAGIVLGDRKAPSKREIERFHSVLASLSEIVAFVVLGLTVHLAVLAREDVWLPGLVLGAVLAMIIRPLVVGLSLLPTGLKPNERNFVLFAGLKGAVPILLGSYLFSAHLPDAQRLYGIVIVVVVLSVLVQGAMTPIVAGALNLPIRRS